MYLITTQKFTRRRPLRRGRFLFTLCILITTGMVAPEAPTNDPPKPPLSRSDARIYEVRIRVQSRIRSSGWPLLPQANWSKVNLDTLVVSTPESKKIPFKVETLQDARQWKLRIPEKKYTIQFDAMSYASKLDEVLAAKVPWPEKWDKTVTLYLEPSKYIESNNPLFKSEIDKLGNPHEEPVHIAAKRIIKYCLNNIKSDGLYSNFDTEVTTGINVNGALYAANNGKGTAADLVCVCVALLRAAGIPARPIVGITNADTVGTKQVDPYYMVWGEYALPEIGWVPIVPKRMRGTVKNLSVYKSWQGLGTLPWLNRRVPLAYNFNCYDVNRANQLLQMFFTSSPK